jgi:nondiscriminating aspartyl-tRNA synthetase
VPAEIPVLHFADAMDMLGHSGEDALDLSPADERELCAWAKERYGSEWLFVSGYPMAKRPFYTHPDPERPGYSRGFDLLFRGMELVTGGQRLHLYRDYLDALERSGLSGDGMSGYLEAFRYGMPPHGGFAIGLERFVARLTGVQNVREVTLFPRTMTRLEP